MNRITRSSTCAFAFRRWPWFIRPLYSATVSVYCEGATSRRWAPFQALVNYRAYRKRESLVFVRISGPDCRFRECQAGKFAEHNSRYKEMTVTDEDADVPQPVSRRLFLAGSVAAVTAASLVGTATAQASPL